MSVSVTKKHPIISQNPIVPTISRGTKELVSRESDLKGKITEVINLTDHAREIQRLGKDTEDLSCSKTKAIFLCLATAVVVATSAHLFFFYLAHMGLGLMIGGPLLAALNYAMIAYTLMETLAAFTGSSPKKLTEEWSHIQQERGRVAHTSRNGVNEVMSAFNSKKASLSSFYDGAHFDVDVSSRLRKINTAQHEVQSAWHWVQG